MNHRTNYLLFCLLVVLCAGCVKPTQNREGAALPGIADVSAANPDGTLVMVLGGEATYLNPILLTDTASGAVVGTLFNGLVRVNEDLEIIPELAQRWEFSDNGLVCDFFLREDVAWHDGHPFTAEDVQFTFDAIMDPATNTVRRSDYIIDEKPIQFKAVHPFVFRAILPKPFAPFLANMSIGIIPKHILNHHDINTAAFNQRPVGTGPFRFLEWQSSDHITVVRNDDYFNGRPKLAKILFRVVPDANTRLVALKTGEIDEADIPPKDYPHMKRARHIHLFEYDSLAYTYFGFNLDNPLFASRMVRHALAYAVDKKKMVTAIFQGLGTPAYAPIAPVSWAYNPDVNQFAYDPKRAEALLTKEGWSKGTDGILTNGKRRFEFTVITNKGNKEREKAAVILQSFFSEIGVKMNIQLMEWSAELKILNSPIDPKAFDAVIIGWSLGIDPDDYNIWHSSQFPRGFNFVHYASSDVDRLIERGRTTLDREKRKDIYGRMYTRIADDQPYIFLYYPKTVVGVRDRVGGLSRPGPAGLFLYMENVFVTS